MKFSHLWLFLCVVAIGLSSQLLPHPHNFTSMNAIALLGTALLGSLPRSLAALFTISLIHDCIFGFHSTLFYVYSSYALIAWVGSMVGRKKPIVMVISSLAASLTFFFITNLGVWINAGIYPHTLEGLSACYIAALPFLKNQMAGDLFFAILLNGLCYLIEQHNIKAATRPINT